MFGSSIRHRSAASTSNTNSALCNGDEHNNNTKARDHKHHKTIVSTTQATNLKLRNRLALMLLFTLLLLFLTYLISYARRVYCIINGTIDENSNQHSKLLEQWIIYPYHDVSQRKGTVIATLVANPSSNMMEILAPSIQDKLSYAKHNNYTFVVCPISLDQARLPQWSKLKLIWLLFHEGYHTVLWIDLDTVIWNKHWRVSQLFQLDNYTKNKQLIAQIDINRNITSMYLNSGVMLLRNNEWTLNLLERAYQQWHVILLKGWYYWHADQDAINLVLGSRHVSLLDSILKGQRRTSVQQCRRSLDLDQPAVTNQTTNRRRSFSNYEYYNNHDSSCVQTDHHGYSNDYIQLMKYGKLWSLPKDVHSKTFIVHLPGCYDNACVKTLLDVRIKANKKTDKITKKTTNKNKKVKKNKE